MSKVIPMSLERRLWGQPASVWLLLGATALLLFTQLGAAELWTLEGRWAGVCMHMLRSGDYLHPYLFGDAYYDKPLLSYWLALASARLLGGFNETALRLPSAFSGLLAVNVPINSSLSKSGTQTIEPMGERPNRLKRGSRLTSLIISGSRCSGSKEDATSVTSAAGDGVAASTRRTAQRMRARRMVAS